MAVRADINKIKEKIRLFKLEINKKGYEDARFILFGSWAKGNIHEWSDIDICVVSNKFKKNYFDRSVEINVVASSIDPTIEAVPMVPEDLENKYYTLASEVKRYGIEV